MLTADGADSRIALCVDNGEADDCDHERPDLTAAALVDSEERTSSEANLFARLAANCHLSAALHLECRAQYPNTVDECAAKDNCINNIQTSEHTLDTAAFIPHSDADGTCRA